MNRAKARYVQKKQFVEPTGRKDNINYESFSTFNDESVEEIVALVSTLGFTWELPEEDEFFYGDDKTNWCEQHYKVWSSKIAFDAKFILETVTNFSFRFLVPLLKLPYG